MKWQTRDYHYMKDRNRAIMLLIEIKPETTIDWPYWLIMLMAVMYFAWQFFR